MQVNALFKKSAPAPAKTATKTVKKSAPRKAAPTKVAKGDALAKWYGAYRFVRFVGFSRRSTRAGLGNGR